MISNSSPSLQNSETPPSYTSHDSTPQHLNGYDISAQAPNSYSSSLDCPITSGSSTVTSTNHYEYSSYPTSSQYGSPYTSHNVSPSDYLSQQGSAYSNQLGSTYSNNQDSVYSNQLGYLPSITYSAYQGTSQNNTHYQGLSQNTIYQESSLNTAYSSDQESIPSTLPPDYDEVIRDTKGKTPVQYNFGRGPLSSLLNAANAHLLAPRGTAPLLPLSSLKSTAGKMAKDFVEDMLSETLDRKEERDRRRSFRKTEREQDIARISEQWDGLVKNVFPETEGRLEKKQHGPLVFEEDWSGNECSLKTSNGPLTVRGKLRARDHVSLENRNGSITLEQPLFTSGQLHIKNRNGALELKGSVQVGKLEIQLRNAPISIDSHLESKYTEIKTRNGPIMLTQVIAKNKLTVKTTNSPIVLHVLELESNSDISVESTNAPVTVYLPRTFSGRFSVTSNSSSTASVTPRTLNYQLVLDRDEVNRKQGWCINMGNKSNAQISVKTTHAPALLYI
ncbi:hypothetical protein G6F56_006941 [Rhizopus delemar]|nr:hypothetical protein G6F56_006941 [Rhizopus delemar]